jgi:diguanylate cyclase (GGDEF)-like protein/PAS domain S-box-containing protein
MIVEDEAIIAVHLQRILAGFGYHVPVTVETGNEAIRQISDLHPDLVLMDIRLRGEMDGIETAHRIRELHDLPVVYLTAYADDARLIQASKTEPYGYLVKPVQERELHATLQMAINKHHLDRKLRESEAAYRELYHNTPAMLHTTNVAGVIIQVSDYWLASLGYTRDEVINHHYLDFVTPATRRMFIESVEPEFFHSGITHDAECEMVMKDGRVMHAYYSSAGIYGEDGNLTGGLAALVDITARKRAQEAERDQRALAEALRDTSAALNSTLSFEEVLERVITNVSRVAPHDAVNIMLITDDNTARIVRSHGYKELGLEEEKILATRFPIDGMPQLKQMAETRQPVVFSDTTDLEHWSPDWIHSYAGAPISVKGSLVGFINLISRTPGFYRREHASRLQAFADQAAVAIENARLYADLERLATIDEVTGIFNRHRLFELGQREYERARRYKTPLAAILLDIDHFKKINDTYGHNTGDRVLAGMAAAIRRRLREVDLFGRYGGEEFVVLLPQTEHDPALEVAERLRGLVAGLNFDTDQGLLSVTISLGVVMMSPDIPSLATLIDRADQAMYAAKQAGRNRVKMYQ